MTSRRFLVPVIVAATAHAALFVLFPSAPALPSIGPGEFYTCDLSMHVPVPPDPPPAEPAPGEPGAGGGAAVAAIPEPLTPPGHEQFLIELSRVPIANTRLPTPRIPRNPWAGDPRLPGLGGPAQVPFDPSALDREPRARVRIAPDYPYEAKRLGLEGDVVVAFVVNADGSVRDAEVVRADRPEFEAAALKAVRRWKFEPGRHRGVAVPFRMTVPIVFRITAD